MNRMPPFNGRRDLTGRWQSYTPAVTGFVPGASVISARWSRVGDIGFYRIKVVLGVGFSLPAGATFSFPFTLREESRYAGADLKMQDAGTANYSLIAHQDPARVSIWPVTAGGAYTGIWPFALAAGDYFYISGGGEIQP